MCSSSIGDLLKVKLLLAHEHIEVNARNDTGCTALHYAASKGHTDVVSALLQHEGIQLDIQDNHGKTTPLIRSITNHHLHIAKKLIDKRARTNLRDCEGNTALHYAIAMENVELAVDLLNHGALDNIKNNDNQTPLDIASSFMKNRLEEEL